MPIDCTPQGLATAAQCFEACVPDGMHPAIQTYLLATIANTLAGTSLDPNTLSLAAGCFRCLDGNHGAVQDYLLCQIATASGA